MHIKFTEVNSKFSQILNEPFQNDQMFLISCPTGVISPNLVTLVEIEGDEQKYQVSNGFHKKISIPGFRVIKAKFLYLTKMILLTQANLRLRKKFTS